MNSVRRLRVRRCVPECGAPQFVATRADHVNEGFWQIIFAQETWDRRRANMQQTEDC
jgi:hypothetical protein